jgi:Rab proteins geranylgeranyltransferase component A
LALGNVGDFSKKYVPVCIFVDLFFSNLSAVLSIIMNDRDYFDIAVVGTGLVESFVACAASQCGKKVLHVDSLDYYGRNESSLNLKEFVEECQRQKVSLSTSSTQLSSSSSLSVSEGSVALQQIKGPESIRRLLSTSDSDFEETGVIFEWNKRRMNHLAMKGYFEKDTGVASNDSTQCHPCFFGYRRPVETSLRRVMLDSRLFCIDMSCKFILGTGNMVDALVNSGTANYLEFKGIDCLVYVPTSGSVGDYGSHYNNDTVPSYIKVPCSKGDIFNSCDFSALEKRKMMKFMQSAMDWGHEDHGQSVTLLNESILAQGRSLHRPQNKEQKHSSFNVEAFRDKCVLEFFEDLKLPTRLRQTIIYALCLRIGPLTFDEVTQRNNMYTSLEAMQALYRHLAAIGRFGKTAFIYPMYGTAEITQSFCRMCAVWGGTYMLRSTAKQVTIQDDKVTNLTINGPDGETTFNVGAFVCTHHEWPSFQSLAKTLPLHSTTVLVTRTCIYRGHLFPESQGCLCVIPPFICNNPNSIHVMQVDASMQVCPTNYSIVYMTSTFDTSVATTDEVMNEIMAKASNLLENNKTKKDDNNSICTPIFHCTYARPLHTSADYRSRMEKLPQNVGVVVEEIQETYMHAALDQARDIFERLFPGEPFLVKKKTEADNADNDEDALLNYFPETEIPHDEAQVEKNSRQHSHENNDGDI